MDAVVEKAVPSRIEDIVKLDEKVFQTMITDRTSGRHKSDSFKKADG